MASELPPVMPVDLFMAPVMPVDLFMATVEGNSNVLIPRLGLQPEETTDQIQVTIEATHSSPEQINTELQSATAFGDTVLHLLVTYGHNVLALKVFQRDRSLLNAQNKMSETPLHCAAKVGNEEFMCKLIELDPVIVKVAIKEIDDNGDAPFHVAAKHCHVDVIRKLMEWDPTLAQRVNTPKIAHRVNTPKMLCPLQIAIMKNYTKMVKEMLEVDPNLACIPFSDGMFPVHVSASMGNIELVKHFIEHYPNCAKLLDPHGRNLFHIAAEENQTKIFTGYQTKFFTGLSRNTNIGEMIAQMNSATDNEGNTPSHIAAMKGNMLIVMGNDRHAGKIRNNEGLTPYQLSLRQRQEKETNEDKWQKVQVLGLGAVLITTVTFAAAFTIPGSYNQENGTPVLGKKYMFRAFILTNTFAFIQGFASLLVLLWETDYSSFYARLRFATIVLLSAVGNMVVTFGVGMYVMLAPICYHMAVIILVITLITGSPVGIYFITVEAPKIMDIVAIPKAAQIGFALALSTIFFPLIFCLALA